MGGYSCWRFGSLVLQRDDPSRHSRSQVFGRTRALLHRHPEPGWGGEPQTKRSAKRFHRESESAYF